MDDQQTIIFITVVFIVVLCIICTCKSIHGHEGGNPHPRPRPRPRALSPHHSASPVTTCQPPSTGLDPSAMAALPIFAYRNPTAAHGEEGMDRTTCTICQGVMEEGEMVRLLPICMHVLHVECVDMWLSSHSTCPVCRAEAEPAKVAERVMELRVGSELQSPP